MKVSIVLTVYNCAQYLGEAIKSFLAQTYTHAELLIWDDGSTDSSLEIANKYADQDQRIRVIAAPHQGRSNALYEAMQAVTGEYVGWLDSDDLLCPTTLEDTAAILDQYPKVGMVYTDYLVIDKESNIRGLGNRCIIPYSKERLLVDFMTFHFRLFRYSIYKSSGGINQEMKYAMDYDFCLRMSETAAIWHLKKTLYYYRTHALSTSKQYGLEQLYFSCCAVQNALKRRGMDKHYCLEIEPGATGAKFILKKL